MCESLTLLGVVETAQALNINQRAVRELFNKRALPLVKIGRRLYVREADLARFLDESRITGSQSAGEEQSAG